ncbi:MAG: carboxymuconolactone decarboxylase family protein [Thermoanaerobaculia bacterium]
MSTPRRLAPVALAVAASLVTAGLLLALRASDATQPARPATASAEAAPGVPAPVDRAAVYREIEGMFGLVPTMFKLVPDDELELEWRLFKKVQFDAGPIPNKYRELIGLGLSAIAKCQYCVAYHTEVARLFGATDAEIESAVHYAKSSAGWSAYLNGMQIDLAQFKAEVRSAVAYARAQADKTKGK